MSIYNLFSGSYIVCESIFQLFTGASLCYWSNEWENVDFTEIRFSRLCGKIPLATNMSAAGRFFILFSLTISKILGRKELSVREQTNKSYPCL